MEYSREYFLDEVRDGFLVPGRMKRAWKKDLQNYRALCEICQKLGIHVSAMWGTLIGAIRNGGFIPWDDDVDTQMLHDEYNKLYDYLADDTETEQWISDYIFDESENMTRRFMSSRSLIEPVEKWKEGYGFPFVSILDIFVFEYMPIDGEKGKEYWESIYEAGRTKEFAKENGSVGLNLEMANKIKALEHRLGVKINRDIEGPLFIKILAMMDEYTARFTKSDSDHIGIPAYYDRNKSFVAPKELYAHYIDVKFEDESISVPIGYDGILRRYFGNYMRPVMAGGVHNYPFYEAMDKDAKKLSGYGLASYECDEEAVIKVKNDAKNTAKPSTADKASETIKLFEEAHTAIVEFVKSDINSAVGLIGQCQELAIETGNDIEKNAKDELGFVRTLEEYCESLFGVFQKLDSEGEIETNADMISEELNRHLDNLRQALPGLKDKKKVVFLYCRNKDIDSFLELYNAALNDDTVVSAIKVPMYYKDFEGRIDKNSIVEDVDDTPSGIETMPFDSYDFSIEKPDVVLYQYPYDEYAEGMSLHPYYYIKNIAVHAKKLVLIPPFRLDEKKVAFSQSVYTIGTFLKNPGGVYADSIIVRTEAEKGVFEGIVKEFVPRRADDIKVVVADLGSSKRKPDKAVNTENTENIDDPEGSFDNNVTGNIVNPDEHNGVCKQILYRLGASMLYEYGQVGIDKAKKVLSYLEGYEGKIDVIWSPDPYAEEILCYKKEIKKAYDELLFGEYKNVTICNDENEEELAISCDGMYGDGCVLMNECRMNGKPVLLENPSFSDCIVFDNNCEQKKWTDDIMVADEGEKEHQWSLDEFVRAVVDRKNKVYDTDCCDIEKLWLEIKNEI